MQLNIKILTTLVLFFISIGCSSEQDLEKTTNNISSYIQNQNINSRYVLLVPNTGCPGCISTAELFIGDYYKNEDLFIILTRITSQKAFEIRTGITIDSTSNIIVDHKNNFSVNGPDKIYPALFLNENKTLTFKGFQKPGNSVFNFLEKQLN